jgi:hypothetical protein
VYRGFQSCGDSDDNDNDGNDGDHNDVVDDDCDTDVFWYQ